MENNPVVGMIDEEIARLEQVRSILESLLHVEAVIVPALDAVASETSEHDAPAPAPSVSVRLRSRRGISTGRRGPRKRYEVAPPRALDAPIPIAPVVVKRVIAPPKPAVQAVPAGPPADGTLESLVRSMRPDLRVQGTTA